MDLKPTPYGSAKPRTLLLLLGEGLAVCAAFLATVEDIRSKWPMIGIIFVLWLSMRICFPKVRKWIHFKLSRILRFRSQWHRLREKRMLRATVAGDRVEIAYLGRNSLAKNDVLDIYRSAEYWGLRACSVVARKPGVVEIWYRSQVLRSLGIPAGEARKSAAESLFCTYGMPLVFERDDQSYPGAFDLLAEKVGQGLNLTLRELDELTRGAVLGSLPAEEGSRLAFALR